MLGVFLTTETEFLRLFKMIRDHCLRPFCSKEKDLLTIILIQLFLCSDFFFEAKVLFRSFVFFISRFRN